MQRVALQLHWKFPLLRPAWLKSMLTTLWLAKTWVVMSERPLFILYIVFCNNVNSKGIPHITLRCAILPKVWLTRSLTIFLWRTCVKRSENSFPLICTSISRIYCKGTEIILSDGEWPWKYWFCCRSAALPPHWFLFNELHSLKIMK